MCSSIRVFFPTCSIPACAGQKLFSAIHSLGDMSEIKKPFTRKRMTKMSGTLLVVRAQPPVHVFLLNKGLILKLFLENFLLEKKHQVAYFS